jgi:Protein of unknown function (DUF3604).
MNKYWGDFHTNMHHNHMDDFEQWVDFAKTMVDFWGPVYYPYRGVPVTEGFRAEGLEPIEETLEAWKVVNEKSQRDDFIIYPSYEWQGNGADGDHNVFFSEFDEDIYLPNTYAELCDILGEKNAIALPHHPGYKPGHRGKNWETHNDKVSPVVEIYSSHGSSEASDADIPLNVHMHMGPRGEEGTVYWALKQGVKTGIIASGDNHKYPAISGNGYFAVYCDQYDRNAILDAMRNRHTYGVTRSKMDVHFDVNGSIMGSEIDAQAQNTANLRIEGSNAIKAIEVVRNGICEHTYNYHPVRTLPESGVVKFKFELELGWGPDRRLFKDISQKWWDVRIHTEGKIHGCEHLWTSPGSTIEQVDEQTLIGRIITRKEDDGNGKLSQKNYLTPYIQNQSVIIEIEDDINNDIIFEIDELTFRIPARKLLTQSILEAKEEQVAKLLKESFDFDSYYREDPWWHNAYKFVIHKASLASTYTIEEQYDIGELERDTDNVMIKVIQYNGDIAWTSPVYINKK